MLQRMKIAGVLNSNDDEFQLWKQDNRPIELRDSERLYQKLKHIHNNPVESCFVEKEEE
jgi:putative transposase